MASRWCFMEITHARALGKHLFPIKIDDCDVSGVLTDRQVIDFSGNREEALQRLWRGMLAAGIDPNDAFDWDGRRPPYPGLLAFQEEDAAIFFGRDEEIGEGLDVLNRVRRLGQTALVMVLGASGSGKSSLVRAGLIPRLRRDAERWLVVDPFRPREDPARELSAVVSRAFDRMGRSVQRDVIAERLRDALARVQRASAGARAVTGPEANSADPAPFLQKVGELEALLPEGARPRDISAFSGPSPFRTRGRFRATDVQPRPPRSAPATS
jgi:AAA ATPase domain